MVSNAYGYRSTGQRRSVRGNRCWHGWHWRALIALVCVFVALLGPVQVSVAQAPEYDPDLSHPITGYKLIVALRGTTPQAERIADAIEAFEINICLLQDENFQKGYEKNGGKNSPVAFVWSRY